MEESAVLLDGVTRTYGKGATEVAALRQVSVGFPRGSFTAVMGPSGSGKSTLLQCASGLDRPQSGAVRIAGRDITRLPEKELAVLRRDRIGVIFQAFNLVPSLTAWQNVILPSRLARRRPDPAHVRELLRRVGLAGRESHRPAQLSGGQQQRVAIARALLGRPDVLFADEPTGALDRSTGHEVLALLREAVDAFGQTVVMVTHDPEAAARADAVLFLTDGRVTEVLDRPSAAQIGGRL
ncbi:putative ABC transport system ATP-binding protein [Nonomuraea solani]|uniref:Putative ABC transport system ATP-binding protein n=1 Tax=Nonomuraea solani TaxID=1144553 RepID=A0A1H6EQV6_9ACTN|nr:ABC transporter ATP-binding protein [Nonomuraea solani]SEH00237.1 putative ABC transport system ATP-binding protein [Nonomuraea solani]